MQNLYEVLQNPTLEVLKLHSIEYFDKVIEKYPQDYEKIISFINDCYNFKSPLLVQEKVWELFLLTRFKVRKIPDELRPDILELKSDEFVVATDSFLKYQKEPIWETLVLKQNFRISVMSTIRGHVSGMSEKKTANELLTTLDAEINAIFESLKQSQEPLGKYKGYDSIVGARSKIKINIAGFINEN